ncbi:MAG: hypothetical protein ACAH17_03730 [Candidatus Paceibacterota bacterium]
MHPQSPLRAKVQGEINGSFEVHFGAVLKKGANITARLCREWNNKGPKFVIGGVRRNGEFRKRFEEHFHVEAWITPDHLLDPSALWEKCVEWEESFKCFPSLNGDSEK